MEKRLNNWELITITSIAENTSHWDNPKVWIKNSKQERSKESVGDLFQDTDQNGKRIKEYQGIEKSIEELRIRLDPIKESMSKIKLESEDSNV